MHTGPVVDRYTTVQTSSGTDFGLPISIHCVSLVVHVMAQSAGRTKVVVRDDLENVREAQFSCSTKLG